MRLETGILCLETGILVSYVRRLETGVWRLESGVLKLASCRLETAVWRRARRSALEMYAVRERGGEVLYVRGEVLSLRECVNAP